MARTEDHTAILVASLNEESGVEATLRSLRAGRVQPGLLILVDSHSTDRTVELARPFVDHVYTAPKGKLTATDAAIRALPKTTKLVAMADADTTYPEHWLAVHDAAHRDVGVVMTHGPSRMDPFPPAPGFAVSEVVRRAYDGGVTLSRITSGRNRVVRKQAYLEDPLRTWVQQGRLPRIFLEEEVLFTRRLSKQGRVRFLPEAWCHTSNRRGDLAGKHWQQALSGERF